MVDFAKARCLACCLGLLLINFGVRSIAANASGLSNEALVTAVASSSVTVPSAERPIAVALMEPSLARTDLPSTNPFARPGVAHFFTINEVLATHHQAVTQPPPPQLAATNVGGSVLDVPSGINPQAVSEEPFGILTFRAPEGALWDK